MDRPGTSAKLVLVLRQRTTQTFFPPLPTATSLTEINKQCFRTYQVEVLSLSDGLHLTPDYKSPIVGKSYLRQMSLFFWTRRPLVMDLVKFIKLEFRKVGLLSMQMWELFTPCGPLEVGNVLALIPIDRS